MIYKKRKIEIIYIIYIIFYECEDIIYNIFVIYYSKKYNF